MRRPLIPRGTTWLGKARPPHVDEQRWKDRILIVHTAAQTVLDHFTKEGQPLHGTGVTVNETCVAAIVSSYFDTVGRQKRRNNLGPTETLTQAHVAALLCQCAATKRYHIFKRAGIPYGKLEDRIYLEFLHTLLMLVLQVDPERIDPAKFLEQKMLFFRAVEESDLPLRLLIWGAYQFCTAHGEQICAVTKPGKLD